MTLILSGTDGLSDVDGSAATPAIRGTDANTGIFFPAADTIAFSEGGAEAMRIDSSGRVGIGTDSPATTLHLKAAVCNVRLEDADTSAYANVGVDNSGSMYLQADPANSQASSTMYFSIDGTERMRIDSSGNVGIGITSPACKLDLAGGSGTSQIAIRIRSLSTNSNGFNIITNSSTDDIYLNNHYSSAMLFGTSNTERARIDSSGNLLVGATNASQIAGLGIKMIANATGQYFAAVTDQTTNGGHTNYHLYSTGAAAYRFYVGAGGTIFATSTTISSLSDVRHKENIRDLNVGLSEIMALKPRLFDWKQGKGADTKNARGFIAQEFETVFPDLIDEWKDPAPEGEDPYKSVRAELIPVLVKAIQELKALVDTQASTITTLTDRITALEAPTGTQA